MRNAMRWLARLTAGFLPLMPFVVVGQAMPDAFTQGRGRTTASISTTTETANQFYLSKTKMDLSAIPAGVNRVTTDTYSLYVAHGLTDSLDVVATLPYIGAYSHGPGSASDLKSFQDGSVSLKWRFWQHHSHALGTGWISVASSTGVGAPLSNYNGDAFPDIGHHATALDQRLILQYIWARGLFVVLEGGYTARDGQHPDSIPISAKLGYFTRRFYLESWMDKQVGRGGINVGAGPLSLTGQDYVVVGGRGTAYVFQNLGLSVAGSTTLSGRNVLKKTAFSAGLVYRPD